MNCISGDEMNQNQAAGITLVVISLGFLAYVSSTIASYGEGTYLSKQTVVWLLLQCSVSVFIGILGGYFLGLGRKSQTSRPSSQDSSVQE